MNKESKKEKWTIYSITIFDVIVTYRHRKIYVDHPVNPMKTVDVAIEPWFTYSRAHHACVPNMQPLTCQTFPSSGKYRYGFLLTIWSPIFFSFQLNIG